MRAPDTRRRVVQGLQRRVLNPLDKVAFALGAPPPGDALLETIGRRTGRRRVTPVCDGLVGESFWVIAQRGRRSGYVRNIEANPRVRIKVRDGWRTGVAHVVDDDPSERERTLGESNRWRSLCLRASRGMMTSGLTVRIDLEPESTARLP